MDIGEIERVIQIEPLTEPVEVPTAPEAPERIPART
jgi:hypothetical protein